MKTNAIKTFFYATLLLIAFNSCKKEAELTDPTDTPTTENETPDPDNTNTGEPTEIGTPIGQAITKNIGAEGGIIESPNKSFSISIPAGAFSSSTSVTIQPITNNAPNGIDSLAYRISSSADIAKPATIAIKLTEEQHLANGGVRLAFQNDKKVWMANSAVAIESSNYTYVATTAKIKNLDLSFVASAKMNLVVSPADNNLLLMLPIKLQVWGIPEILVNNYPPGTWVPVKKPKILKEEDDGIIDWYVNDRSGGDHEVGTISNAAYSEPNYSGDYGAPVFLPAKNPVNLSVDVKAGKGMIILEKNIKIIQDNHIVSALGTTSATQANFNAPGPSASITIIDNINPDDPSDFTQGLGVEIKKGFTGSSGSYRFTFSDDCEAKLTDNVTRKAVGSTTWYDKQGNKRYSSGEVIITSYRKSTTNPGFAVMEGTISGTAYFIKEVGVYETEPFTATFKCVGLGGS